jgi:signal transduction histidine kinase
VISGLRPATLDQLGLHTALEELLDDLTDRGELMEVCPILELDLTPERRRYDRDVELHLFRIVQQASYNVLQHAKAEHLVIRGQLEQDAVKLEVVDDGVGFVDGYHPDLRDLLGRQHFGLVTMYERASLIGARVEIESAPGEGTRVKIFWRQEQPD